MESKHPSHISDATSLKKHFKHEHKSCEIGIFHLLYGSFSNRRFVFVVKDFSAPLRC
jgi:hypothetical protein